MKTKIPPITDEEEAEIQRMIAERFSDNPEAHGRGTRPVPPPFAEVFPELAESIRRNRGRPPKPDAKLAVTLRLDPNTVARFKAPGPRLARPGWAPPSSAPPGKSPSAHRRDVRPRPARRGQRLLEDEERQDEERDDPEEPDDQRRQHPRREAGDLKARRSARW